MSEDRLVGWKSNVVVSGTHLSLSAGFIQCVLEDILLTP